MVKMKYPHRKETFMDKRKVTHAIRKDKTYTERDFDHYVALEWSQQVMALGHNRTAKTCNTVPAHCSETPHQEVRYFTD